MVEDYTLDDLEKQTEIAKEELSNRLKRNYELARQLGFSAVEASLLKGRSEETIRRLAEERKAQTST